MGLQGFPETQGLFLLTLDSPGKLGSCRVIYNTGNSIHAASEAVKGIEKQRENYMR